MKTINIFVIGMMCQHCVNRIEGILKSVEGVSSVSVDLGKGEALIIAEDAINVKTLTEAVEDAGFDVGGCTEA